MKAVMSIPVGERNVESEGRREAILSSGCVDGHAKSCPWCDMSSSRDSEPNSPLDTSEKGNEGCNGATA